MFLINRLGGARKRPSFLSLMPFHFLPIYQIKICSIRFFSVTLHLNDLETSFPFYIVTF